MVLNYIWLAFFLTAFAVASVRLIFFGDTTVFPDIINSTFASSKTAFEISLGLTGVLSLAGHHENRRNGRSSQLVRTNSQSPVQ